MASRDSVTSRKRKLEKNIRYSCDRLFDITELSALEVRDSLVSISVYVNALIGGMDMDIKEEANVRR